MRRTYDPGSLSRLVLSSKTYDAERGARALFDEVERLFPKQFAELRALESSEYDDDGEDEPERPDFSKKRGAHVEAWTNKYGISCPTVDLVAMDIVIGDSPRFALTQHYDVNGQRIEDTPDIHAEPFTETLKEFMRRARQHYVETRLQFKKLRFKDRAIKRDQRHFGYLAARQFGGHSWEEIATGNVPRAAALPPGDQETIEEEVRKLKRLLGLPFGKPGRPSKTNRR